MATHSRPALRSLTLCLAAVVGVSTGAFGDHNGSHTTPCGAATTVGDGTAGNSPGPVGPPDSLGWDVGSGQCNGSFTVTSAPGFPLGALELGLRAEERRVGQLAPGSPGDYEVETGHDDNAPPATNRAWWNFQLSIAFGGAIADLDALTLQIRTDASTNLPASPTIDLLALRGAIDDRNNQPNATTGFADLYQVSQNPEFGWFMTASDDDANPTGAFDYDEEGAWRFRLTATEGISEAAAEVCIHTPNAACLYPVLGVALAMTPQDAMLPATIELDYTLENLGDDDLTALDVVSDLVPVFGVHGVDWTFTSISSVPGPLANASFDGHTDTQLIAGGQGLAAASVGSLTVSIELLTVDAADGTGDFCHQVTAGGVDSLGAPYADLSEDGADPDPNGDGDPVEASQSCFNQSSVPVTLQGFSVQ